MNKKLGACVFRGAAVCLSKEARHGTLQHPTSHAPLHLRRDSALSNDAFWGIQANLGHPSHTPLRNALSHVPSHKKKMRSAFVALAALAAFAAAPATATRSLKATAAVAKPVSFKQGNEK